MKKRIIVSIIGCMFLSLLGGCKSTSPAPSDSSEMSSEALVDTEASGEDMSAKLPQPVFSFETGAIESVDSQNHQITLVSDKMSESAVPENAVTLNISDETYFIEAGEAKLTDMNAIKKGDEIFAWVSPAYTKSLPPQTSARVILTNIDDNDIPALVKSESVEIQDDKIILNDADGTVWSFDKETSPVIISDNEAIAFDKIEAGTDCLIWPKVMPADTDIKDDSLAAERIIVLK